MERNYNFFKLGSLFMVLTGIVHLVGHFLPPKLDTDAKSALYDAMNTIEFDIDGIFVRTIMDLFNAFSLFLTIMLLTLGAVNFIISRLDMSSIIRKKLALTNFIGMIGMLALSIIYAFSVPIVLFGLTACIFLVAAIKS